MSFEDGNMILEQAIIDGKDYLPRLKEGLVKVAVMLQEGKEGEGIDLFIQSIEGLEWLSSFLSAMSHFRASFVYHNEQGSIAENYQQILRDLLGAWENRDTVLIGDLLEYEVVPLIDLVSEQLIQERVN